MERALFYYDKKEQGLWEEWEAKLYFIKIYIYLFHILQTEIVQISLFFFFSSEMGLCSVSQNFPSVNW